MKFCWEKIQGYQDLTTYSKRTIVFSKLTSIWVVRTKKKKKKNPVLLIINILNIETCCHIYSFNFIKIPLFLPGVSTAQFFLWYWQPHKYSTDLGKAICWCEQEARRLNAHSGLAIHGLRKYTEEFLPNTEQCACADDRTSHLIKTSQIT